MTYSFFTSSGVRLDIEITAWEEARAPLDADTQIALQVEHVAELAWRVKSIADSITDSGFRPTPKS